MTETEEPIEVLVTESGEICEIIDSMRLDPRVSKERTVLNRLRARELLVDSVFEEYNKKGFFQVAASLLLIPCNGAYEIYFSVGHLLPYDKDPSKHIYQRVLREKIF